MGQRLGLAAFVPTMLIGLSLTACAEGPSAEERLRQHYEDVIRPQTQVGLALVAETCDSGTPAACEMYARLRGELPAIRLARYWEAMQWLDVSEPGEEILPELVAIQDDCSFGEGLEAQAMAGMCQFFRSEQLPPCASGGTGRLEDSLAGFQYCVDKLARQ